MSAASRYEFSHQRILILVKTYPHPSESSIELVCTAGITQDGAWIRLYPVDFRYQPEVRRFKKYQWINVDTTPRDLSRDGRKESRVPNLRSIQLGGWLPPGDWSERRKIVGRAALHTMDELHALYEEDRTSLGIVSPLEILDVEVCSCTREWPPRWQEIFTKISLFGERTMPLHKVPYTFRYVFRCPDSREVYKRAILDWELGALFWHEVRRLGSEGKAASSVRQKFLDQMCAPSRDTRLFVGTHWPYNTWLVLGVFWPPKDQ